MSRFDKQFVRWASDTVWMVGLFTVAMIINNIVDDWYWNDGIDLGYFSLAIVIFGSCEAVKRIMQNSIRRHRRKVAAE